ncbi:hypothetical protein [Streptomyces sp. MI02-7b]|uniref:hypothetical protein n=1 Tax=Streptomyces sp. MI02-7b TaxID=462941 RepID=UPI0029B1D7BF|nr:hypothetical protein [Streptomyces sp. MI02-7b]MDX3077664.1 hypothetical protein [Streptomyces sp. MI02-7b]
MNFSSGLLLIVLGAPLVGITGRVIENSGRAGLGRTIFIGGYLAVLGACCLADRRQSLTVVRPHGGRSSAGVSAHRRRALQELAAQSLDLPFSTCRRHLTRGAELLCDRHTPVTRVDAGKPECRASRVTTVPVRSSSASSGRLQVVPFGFAPISIGVTVTTVSG